MYVLTHSRVRCVFVAMALLATTALPAPVHAQAAKLVGSHEVETLPYEIPGTGRIGGVTLDRYGYLYVANQDEGVWKLHPDGTTQRFIDGLYGSASGVPLPNGDLIHSEYNGDRLYRVERDGTRHVFVDSGLEGPVGIVQVGEFLYTVNAKSNWIARVSMNGQVYEFARDPRLRVPNGITADPQGNLYVVSLGNQIILKVSPAGDVSEVAVVPGRGNASVAFAAGALYVTQIWNHVILRVAIDGSWEVVAGDGTAGLRDGMAEESRISFPNGLAASPQGEVLYFNTLEGSMVAGHEGVIRVHKLHVPSLTRLYARTWEAEGMKGLRDSYDSAVSLDDVSRDQILQATYGAADWFFWRSEVEAGLALVEWAAEADSDEARAALQLGRSHSRYGDRDVAEQALERAIALDAGSATASSELEALRAYRQAQAVGAE